MVYLLLITGFLLCKDSNIVV